MSDARHWLTFPALMGAVLGTVSACPLIDNPNHCANMDANPCLAADVCDPCTPSGNGCVAKGTELDQDPDAPGCQSAGGESSTEPTATDTSATTTMDTTMTTTIEPDTTVTVGDTESSTTGEPQPCMGDDDCMDAASPFCSPVLQECVNCMGIQDSDAACADRDPLLPACNDQGDCVQCTGDASGACVDGTPICDTESNTCVPCTEHAECGMAACNLFTGECLSEDIVVTVGPAGQDVTTLADALMSIPAGGEGTIIVFDDDYNEALTVTTSRVVAFLAAPGSSPNWVRTSGANPQLTVTGGATVLLDGLNLQSNVSNMVPALRADDGFAWADRTQVVENNGGAVTAITGSEVVLRNCFLNGPNDLGVLSVQGSTVDVHFSTLAADFGTSTALSCDMASTVTVRDSILVSRSGDAEVVCDVIDAEHTASEAMLTGTGNMQVGDVSTAWFVDYNAGNYHLTGPGATTFADIAEWNDVPREPRVDIDGDARSNADGTPEPAGADLP